MEDLTRLLEAAAAGDGEAAGRLLPLVYQELRQLAARQLAHEKPGQTLQPTALVHEAYLRLVRPPACPPTQGGEWRWKGRRHFFAAAAEAMRRILVENARRKKRQKRGGGRQRVDFDQVELPDVMPCDDLLALDEALEALAQEDPRKAELIKLRFFGGLGVEEAAECLGISRATADRDWAYARAWLYERIKGKG
jgi:RNA polymerase sigma factor (TIGR02999 family)